MQDASHRATDDTHPGRVLESSKHQARTLLLPLLLPPLLPLLLEKLQP